MWFIVLGTATVALWGISRRTQPEETRLPPAAAARDTEEQGRFTIVDPARQMLSVAIVTEHIGPEVTYEAVCYLDRVSPSTELLSVNSTGPLASGVRRREGTVELPPDRLAPGRHRLIATISPRNSLAPDLRGKVVIRLDGEPIVEAPFHGGRVVRETLFTFVVAP